MSNASLIRETLHLYNDLNTNKLVPYNDIRFIYSQNRKEDQGKTYEYHPYTCMNMGLQLGWTYTNDYQANFISQLKKRLNITETYDFTFEYLNKTDGRIIIGNEPHFYNKKNIPKCNIVYQVRWKTREEINEIFFSILIALIYIIK